ncbi:hypothetical protein BRM22_11755 [Xanthomonas oryzae pv. oryzae]|nr:hypothetical protein BRN51_09390 [Xanthomonas oryzae pv. oryzae]AXQ09103.1 hypothetical protein BCR61_10205 [Xanthomonas oryzae pv. oryzae]AXQ75058.1 hypothetical protein BXU03_10060 [Xanthomonas oryzae pv. oryzae]QBA11693.1 hypothetical protein DZA53_16255 [Xanthomonas oryzae pv. oryzae]QBN91106.1 hypothetical protein EBA18_13960 [Xanthomonas oryzae pv. oryzae]
MLVNVMAGVAWRPKGPPALGPVFQPRTVRQLVWKRGDGLHHPRRALMPRANSARSQRDDDDATDLRRRGVQRQAQADAA